MGCSADELGEVLKALGFQMERRPLPPGAGAGTEAEPGAPRSSQTRGGGDVAGQEGTAKTGAGAGGNGTASLEADSAAPEPEEGAGDAPDGDAARYLIVWRPRRRRGAALREGRPARRRRTGAGSRDATRKGQEGAGRRDGAHAAPARKRKGRPAGPGGGKSTTGRGGGVQSTPRKRKTAEIDPNSPFAALGKLKEELEKHAKDSASS